MIAGDTNICGDMIAGDTRICGDMIAGDTGMLEIFTIANIFGH